MKLIRLIKTRRCIITIAFQLSFNVITKIQEIRKELGFNGTRQLLIYSNDVNLFGENINTIKHGNFIRR